MDLAVFSEAGGLGARSFGQTGTDGKLAAVDEWSRDFVGDVASGTIQKMKKKY